MLLPSKPRGTFDSDHTEAGRYQYYWLSKNSTTIFYFVTGVASGESHAEEMRQHLLNEAAHD